MQLICLTNILFDWSLNLHLLVTVGLTISNSVDLAILFCCGLFSVNCFSFKLFFLFVCILTIFKFRLFEFNEVTVVDATD